MAGWPWNTDTAPGQIYQVQGQTQSKTVLVPVPCKDLEEKAKS